MSDQGNIVGLERESVNQRAELFFRAALEGAPDASSEWLRETLARSHLPSEWAVSFAEAGAAVGVEIPVVSDETLGPLVDAGLRHPGHGWSRADFARVALALAVELALADRFAEWGMRLYAQTDPPERTALMRALPFLGQPRSLLGLAVEVSRKHSDEVFAALAYNNPFPAQFFSDANFNQMVLRALFLTVSAGELVGLEERKSPELVRMVIHVVSEQQKAGREISPQALALAAEA